MIALKKSLALIAKLFAFILPRPNTPTVHELVECKYTPHVHAPRPLWSSCVQGNMPLPVHSPSRPHACRYRL